MGSRPGVSLLSLTSLSINPSSSTVRVTPADSFKTPLLLCDLFIQINIRHFYNSLFMEFFTYNWPLMVMIMKLTMMACKDNEKLCSPIMIIIHLCFYVIIVARILNTL